jgi:DNA polymerase-3 subunit gamma/tau
VIARKWRPQSFDQLIGQAHVSQTLLNALKNNRIPHALLFTGPRGTGKTSSARILAKSLRCPNAIDFVPCHKCSDCEDITLSRSVNVIEIDGASNNGVDAIRELRDTVAYKPSSGTYKIYIIDEVHMLSTSAFNALLKTLEEPPDHVVFIMATTEVHKIPQTILSRCQRFDFRSIPTKQIAEHLLAICQKENLQASEEALWIISRQGDGSMRDSQSLLDQVITFSNGPLTKESVTSILGLTDRTLLLESLSGLIQRDSQVILNVIQKIYQAGFDPALFMTDLLENIRNILLLKISEDNSTQLLELPDSEISYLQQVAEQSTEEDLHLLFDMALKAAHDLKLSNDPRIVFEMSLLRMVKAPQLASIASWFSAAEAVAQVAPVPQITQGAKATPTLVSKPSAVPQSSEIHKSAPTAPLNPMSMSPKDRWLELVKKIRSSDAFFAAQVGELLFVELKEKTIILGIPPKMAFLKDQFVDVSARNKLQAFIDQAWGPGYNLELKMGKESLGGTSAQDLVQAEKKRAEEELAQVIKEHPLVKSATQALNGQVKAIRDRRATNTTD